MTPIHHMTADELREVLAAVPACEYTAKTVDANTAEVHADAADRTLATHLRPEVARLFALSRAAVEEVLTLRSVLAKRLAPLNSDVSKMISECVNRTLAGEDMTLNIDEARVVFMEVERLRTTVAQMAVDRADSDARWARALAEEQERTRIAKGGAR